MRRVLNEIDARRLLTAGPVTLVSSSYRGRHNVLPVSYVTVLSMVPPKIGISLQPSRHSFDIIRKTDEFAINIPGRELLHHIQYLGSLSGEQFDKLELTKLPNFRANKLDTILLEGCLGWIECYLEDAIEMGDHFLFVGKVVSVQADDDAFSDHWLLNDNDYKPLHYLGANNYSMLDYVMQARVPRTAEEYGKRLDEAVEEQLELTRDASEQIAEEDYQREEFRRREGFNQPGPGPTT